MKIKKKIPLIDQASKLGFWGGKFGGNYVPETLKKPIEDLEILFNKLKNDRRFLAERDKYFKNWVGTPTRFIKLENLTNHVGGAQIWSKVVSDANGGAHKIYNATVHCLLAKRSKIALQANNEQSHCSCLLYTSPSPRDKRQSRMPSSA